MCEVSKADIQDHVAERLEREAAEKERRRKEKMEAHLYLQVSHWLGCVSSVMPRVWRGSYQSAPST